jgi:hypothetical protein
MARRLRDVNSRHQASKKSATALAITMGNMHRVLK